MPAAADRARHRSLKLAAIGTLAGLFSGLFGVGGGSVIMPLLVLWLGHEERGAAVLVASAAGVGAQMIGAVAIGAAAGIVADLLGVVGGVLFVPGLVFFVGLGQHQAEATSLLAIVPVAIVGTYRQDGYGNVNRTDAVLVGLLSLVGAAAGVALANSISGAFLRDAFALHAVRGGPVGAQGLGKLDWMHSWDWTTRST